MYGYVSDGEILYEAVVLRHENSLGKVRDVIPRNPEDREASEDFKAYRPVKHIFSSSSSLSDSSAFGFFF